MTKKLEQAARQALELMDAGSYIPAMRVLREALAEQAEQEPVAIDWDKAHEVLCDVWNRVISADDGFDELQDLIYAAPVRTKDLTEQEIQDAIINISPNGTGYFLRIARAVIAAYREKNK